VGKSGGVLLAAGEDRPIPNAQADRAVAVAEWKGPAAGLAVLDRFEPPTWLVGSYIWSAVLADLHRRCGNAELANRYRTLAWEAAPTPAVNSCCSIDSRSISKRSLDKPSTLENAAVPVSVNGAAKERGIPHRAPKLYLAQPTD